MRSGVKRVLERGAIVTGAARVARRRRAGSVLILAYHNIVPDGEVIAGDRSLHLPQGDFAWQLDQLMETHRIVSLAEALRAGGSASEQPAVVITFDDAYRGAVTAGVQELRVRDLPATIFVAPAYVGGHTFWWDVLTAENALAPAVRDHALEAEQGEEAGIMAWAGREKLAMSRPPLHATGASEAELATALTHPGIVLGSHTWGHPNLVQLTHEKLLGELQRSQQWLQEHFGARTIPVISYPYGRADDRVWHAAREAGYRAGVMIDGGWLTGTGGNRFGVPRLNVPAGVTRDGFVLRTSGLVTT
jgi:peptidoglycan/xylan/chitin deacetylase (PgdA/CDA1 family)